MLGRTSKVAYIGWRGIQYVELAFDEAAPMTALTGVSGAGKSTLAMCLNYALLPDRNLLDIRPISDMQDPHRAGIDPLGARIDPGVGYAYVVLEVLDRRGKRAVVGVHVSLEDGRGRLTRWHLANCDEVTPLQDLLRIVDGDKETYPDFLDLQRHLATRGIDLVECRTVTEYAEILYAAGVLPSNFSDTSDRSLYAKLLESAFRGGLSHEVATRLRDYLLPEQRKIPDSVGRLQQCTEQLLRTRGALEQAKTDLHRLNATYGTGRAQLLRAIASTLNVLAEANATTARAGQEIAQAAATKERATAELSQLAETERLSQDLKKQLMKARDDSRKQLNAEVDAGQQELRRSVEAQQAARTALDRFSRGEKAWRSAAAGMEHRDFPAVTQFLEEQLDLAERALTTVRAEYEATQGSRLALEASAGTTASEALAARLGATSLTEAFDKTTIEDALELELRLGGLVEGVVGASLEGLSKLPDSDDLPDTFWVLASEPTDGSAHQVGDWTVLPAASGYLVASRRRKLVLGAKNRLMRIGELKAKEQQLLVMVGRKTAERKACRDRRDCLVRDEECVREFLQHRDTGDDLRRLAEDTRRAVEGIKAKLDQLRAKQEVIDADYESKVAPIDKQLAQIPVGRTRADGQLKAAAEVLEAASMRIEAAAKRRLEAEQTLGEARTVLGPSFEPMRAAAVQYQELDSRTFLVEQTKGQSALSRDLARETEERRRAIDEASPQDDASWIRLWPVLRGIVAESVSGDVIDHEGEDLLKTMLERRESLEGDLGKHEAELKGEAKHLHNVIVQEIRRQKARIDLLSRAGEGLAFGNVTGVRIRCSRREDLLEKLQHVADQLSLFATRPDQPVDEILRDVFEQQLKLRYDGKALLDYRTYMDLTIEARRAQGPWDPASSLSGGESIGCGLAVALMLARSLAARGEARAEEFVPLFVVDEAQRLDPAGQAVIVDLARREHFQVLVTAIDIQPEFDCSVYAVAREFKPFERMYTRRLKVRKATAVQ